MGYFCLDPDDSVRPSVGGSGERIAELLLKGVVVGRLVGRDDAPHLGHLVSDLEPGAVGWSFDERVERRAVVTTMLAHEAATLRPVDGEFVRCVSAHEFSSWL